MRSTIYNIHHHQSRYIFLVLFLIFCFITPPIVSAAPKKCGCCSSQSQSRPQSSEPSSPKPTPPPAPKNPYDITNYWTYLKVGTDNKYQVREVICVDFHTPRQGLTRNFPLWNNTATSATHPASRTDIYGIPRVPTRIDVTDFTANVNFDRPSLRHTSGILAEKQYQLGDPNSTITGLKTYELKYLFNAGPDLHPDFDELYFNLIPASNEATAKDIRFQIEMPAPFDPNSLNFTIGHDVGTIERHTTDAYQHSGTLTRADGKKLQYQIFRNTITGHFDGQLANNEALTVRLQLPNHYFRGHKISLPLPASILILIPLFSVLTLGALCCSYQKTTKNLKIPSTPLKFIPVSIVQNIALALIFISLPGALLFFTVHFPSLRHYANYPEYLIAIITIILCAIIDIALLALMPSLSPKTPRQLPSDPSNRTTHK